MVKNPLERINDSIVDYIKECDTATVASNLSSGVAAQTPEKMIDLSDIPNTPDKDDEKRDDFDAFMKPSVENQEKLDK